MRLDRMRVYQASEALVIEVDKLLAAVSAQAPLQADHLERSTDSVLFNTAEGIGSFKPKMKIAAYEIARKESNEVRAVLRRLMLKKTLTYSDIQKAHNLAGAIVGMLTKAIIALERRPSR